LRPEKRNKYIHSRKGKSAGKMPKNPGETMSAPAKIIRKKKANKTGEEAEQIYTRDLCNLDRSRSRSKRRRRRRRSRWTVSFPGLPDLDAARLQPQGSRRCNVHSIHWLVFSHYG